MMSEEEKREALEMLREASEEGRLGETLKDAMELERAYREGASAAFERSAEVVEKVITGGAKRKVIAHLAALKLAAMLMEKLILDADPEGDAMDIVRMVDGLVMELTETEDK